MVSINLTEQSTSRLGRDTSLIVMLAPTIRITPLIRPINRIRAYRAKIKEAPRSY